MKKNIMCVLISLSMILVLSACQKNETTVSKEEPKIQTATDSVEKTSDEAEEIVEESEIEEVQDEMQVEDKRSEAQKFVAQINVGWNLGNTLDAHGAGNSLKSETYWGNPLTTKEMIDAVKAQGFNTIRIPVTYAEHVGPAPDYEINSEWLDRVEEVVNYGMSNDMFVIIDTHHEPDFWLVPTEENEQAISDELAAIWKQVGERFKDYNDHLIFEGMNEPRVKGSDKEWSGGTTKERAVVDHLNQIFIDSVRSTGGNNQERYLIICTYGNNCSDITIRNLIIPEDDHLIVAVHMYTPYVFTYAQASNHISEWDGSKLSDITSQMKTLKTYLYNKGIPVIITEFGAENKNNEKHIVNWIKDFMSAANEYEFKVIWWDNNIYNSNGEKFGIFDRKNCTWYSQAIADALISNSISE